MKKILVLVWFLATLLSISAVTVIAYDYGYKNGKLEMRCDNMGGFYEDHTCYVYSA